MLNVLSIKKNDVVNAFLGHSMLEMATDSTLEPDL